MTARTRRTRPASPRQPGEQEIVDGLKPVCICKGIRKSVFLKHLRAGATTLEQLRRATGAGSGACKGKRCTQRIEELLRQCAAPAK